LPLEILSGCATGASQVVFTAPMEMAKIRMQLQSHPNFTSGPKIKTMTLINEIGYLGLYRGGVACLYRDVAFSGIFFPSFAYLKTKIIKDRKNDSNYLILVFGTACGAVAAFLTNPLDVIKTRMQAQSYPGELVYSNFREAFTVIANSEGYAAFFKGCIPRILRIAPQFGISVTAYEILMKAFPDANSKIKTGANLSESEFEVMMKRSDMKKKWKELDFQFNIQKKN